MRLHITVSGSCHTIALLHLTRTAVQRFQQQHADDWQSRLALLAVGPNRKTQLPAFTAQGEYTPKVNTIRRGMLLQAKHFGVEASVDGLDEVPEQIDSKQTNIRLAPLLRDFDKEDFLGIFHLQWDGAASYVWEMESGFQEEALCLHLENLNKILNHTEQFDLIRNITYQNQPPIHRELERLGKPRMHKPLYRVSGTA